MENKKFLKDALVWFEPAKKWLRVSDLILIDTEKGSYYTPIWAIVLDKIVMFREVYSYEEWMEKYIGTSEDIRKDKHMEKLKVGDKIRIFPKEGIYKGMKLNCTVKQILPLYSPITFEAVEDIEVCVDIDGHEEYFILSDNIKYEKIV